MLPAQQKIYSILNSVALLGSEIPRGSTELGAFRELQENAALTDCRIADHSASGGGNHAGSERRCG
jgi:hypothetical protein